MTCVTATGGDGCSRGASMRTARMTHAMWRVVVVVVALAAVARAQDPAMCTGCAWPSEGPCRTVTSGDSTCYG